MNFFHLQKYIVIRKKGSVLVLHFLSLIISFIILLAFLSEAYVIQKNKILKEASKHLQEAEMMSHTILLPPVPVRAKSFVVYDVHSGNILLSKNETEPLPLASLTKIKTAYLFISRNGLEENIKIPSLGTKHLYDFSLKKNQEWSIRDFIKYMLTISSNDAAEILAMNDTLGREGFIDLMNTSSASTTFFFTSPSGLDTGDSIGGRGSALDMAKLMTLFYRDYPDIFEATTKAKISVSVDGQTLRGIPNTNQEVASYRGLSGSKTGYTDKAGGNLAILYDESFGNPLAIVLLGSTREGRFEDMTTLLAYIDKYHHELLEQKK
jgi:D-alanyl-D-alanine carboxypeptidase